MKSIRALVTMLLASAATLLVACGDPEVPKETVEKNAMEMLTKNVGHPSPQITCPGNLKAKTGTVMVCSIPINDKTHDVTVTVTGVEGSNAKFNVEVAEKPRG